MESLIGLRSFVHVADELSFVRAARRLGMSSSAVGKNVANLEAELGVRLFQRTTRRIVLTDEGVRFHAACRRILADLGDAENMMRAAGAVPQGTLRISLPTIGYRFLLPVLPEFRRLYPEVALDLDFNDRLVDIIDGQFDAVIRSGELADSTLMAKRLGGFEFVLCAAPDYCERRGTPLVPADLAGQDAVRFRFPTTGKLQDWPLQADMAGMTTTLTCSNMEAVRAATIGGMGIAFVPDFLVRNALAAGELVTFLDDHRAMPGQFSIVWPSNRHIPQRLRVFVDFACERIFK